MLIHDHGSLPIVDDGEFYHFRHFQDIDKTKEDIEMMKQLHKSGGYSLDRSKRHVARIPMIEFLRHPEWAEDTSLILKWLQSDEGKQYQIHKINSGKSGQCIVK